jgi:hypothetical protein
MVYRPNTPNTSGAGPTLDMTPEGEFRRPPRAPIGMRIAAGAILVALLAGGIAAAALAFWLAVMLVPVIAGAILVGYLALRFQLWRARGSFRGSGGGGSLRP